MGVARLEREARGGDVEAATELLRYFDRIGDGEGWHDYCRYAGKYPTGNPILWRSHAFMFPLYNAIRQAGKTDILWYRLRGVMIELMNFSGSYAGLNTLIEKLSAGWDTPPSMPDHYSIGLTIGGRHLTQGVDWNYNPRTNTVIMVEPIPPVPVVLSYYIEDPPATEGSGRKEQRQREKDYVAQFTDPRNRRRRKRR